MNVWKTFNAQRRFESLQASLASCKAAPAYAALGFCGAFASYPNPSGTQQACCSRVFNLLNAVATEAATAAAAVPPPVVPPPTAVVQPPNNPNPGKAPSPNLPPRM